MHNTHSHAPASCRLCSPNASASQDESRCHRCVAKGDLVGDVVWQYIEKTVNGSPASGRSAFLLAGLSAGPLEGIVRKNPGDAVCDRSLKIGINAMAAPGLRVDPAVRTSESPVFWRHYNQADIVVFAPSDQERNNTGAGLEQVSRIDGDLIMDQEDAWLKSLDEDGAPRDYLRNMLRGLRASGICIDLDMWVDFILALRDLEFADPADLRVQKAAFALHIPVFGIEKLPKLPGPSAGSSKIPPVGAFRTAFAAARNEVACYAMLSLPKQEPLDMALMRDQVADAREKLSGIDETSRKDRQIAIETIEAMLDDADNIRPGEWRPSQDRFCREAIWNRHAHEIFCARRKSNSKNLGQETLDYIRGDFEDELDEELEAFLLSADAKEKNKGRSTEEEDKAFFDKWRDELANAPSRALYNQWYKRVFDKEVRGHDLLTTLLKGAEALLAEGHDDLSSMDEPCILVRANQRKKESLWEGLDQRIHRLFCFEVNSLRDLLGNSFAWDIDKCFTATPDKEQSAKEARMIPLELYLVERRHVSNGAKPNTRDRPRVKAIWQPGRSAQNAPIDVALPDDIGRLAEEAVGHRRVTPLQEFMPKTHNDRGKQVPTSLFISTSFSDVAGGDKGRTADLTNGVFKEDILSVVRERAGNLRDNGAMHGDDAADIIAAVDTFHDAFCEALEALGREPGRAMSEGPIVRQAAAFGELCRRVRRLCVSDVAKREIRSRIAMIGIVPAGAGEGHAILTAWHPLRLLEKQAKGKALGAFVGDVFRPRLRDRNFSVAFAEMLRICEHWAFPEAAEIYGETFVSVEDVNGYSMLVPAGQIATDRDALEQTSPMAAARFMEGLDDYLRVHPHESSNLSAAIYNSESISLPQEIARQMALRIDKDSNLRCDLVITHHDQRRMREIYADQNTRLSADNLNEATRGFLSRLRVGVEPTATEEGDEGVRDLDLAFLHDAISHRSKTEWEHEPASSEQSESGYDNRAVAMPRRRIGEPDAGSTGVYLTMPDPPKMVADFYDLLYAISKNAVLPDGMHGVLVRSVAFDDPEVKKIIDQAHNLAGWVVSFDRIANRQILRECGVRIIRDISVPGTDCQVIVSATGVGKNVQKLVKEEVRKACALSDGDVDRICEALLEDIVEVSGQKVLSAARYENAAREMIGLSVAKAMMEAALPPGARPIWISLDDYRGWFTDGSGEIADMLSVSILEEDDNYTILMQVGEAKFVEQSGSAAESRKSMKQLRKTAARLRDIFVENQDINSRSAWCARLSNLLINRGGLARLIPDGARRMRFLALMSQGRVDFRLAGESVVCLHDFHDDDVDTIEDPPEEYLRQHVVPTPRICSALMSLIGSASFDISVLKAGSWLSPEGCERGEFSSVGKPRQNSAPCNEETAHRSSTGPDMLTDRPDDAPREDRSNTTTAIEARQADQGCFNVMQPDEGGRPRFMPEPLDIQLRVIREKTGGEDEDNRTVIWAEEMCRSAQKALSHFKMQAHFADPKYRLTPNGVLVTFRGHPTLTLSGMEKRRMELLTTFGIEVLDVRAGPGTVSLFIKRAKRAKVPLVSTWLDAEWPDRDPGVLTNFIVGVREDDGSLLYLNLEGEFAGYEEHGPHTLIAGETKSGKGVLTQSLLLQLIAFNDPRNAELILVDPKKGVDFAWLQGAPHMRRGIVTEIDDAQSVFLELVDEMDRRYELLRKKGVPNLTEYNQVVPAGDRISRIFMVHDEIGAWMANEKDYQDTVLSAVANLGMKARAAGIHLVLITQRADVDAVPGRLRDNMGNRLCLRVQNSAGSRMILNHNGAEKLLGRGHLAAALSGESPPTGQNFFLAQVPFASTENLNILARAAIKHWTT